MRMNQTERGSRIVIEVKKDYNAQVIINQLYKHTPLQQTYSIIMLALIDGQPRVLNLKEVLSFYLDHQKEIILRRSRFDLKKAEERLHIVDGLLVALSRLYEVISLIRRSRDVQTAREGLIKLLSLSEKQAQAILDMRLQRLTRLEISKLKEEHRSLMDQIEYLRCLISDESMILNVISEELQEIKERHGDQRRTQIIDDEGELETTDLIFQEDVVITLTNRGYIKRLPLTTYRSRDGRPGYYRHTTPKR